MDSVLIWFIVLMLILTVVACWCGYMAEKKEKEAYDNFIEAGAITAKLLIRFFKSSESVSNNSTKKSSQSILCQNTIPPENSNRDNNS